MDKFYVYLIRNDINTLDRVFTDNQGVKEYLSRRGDIVAVLRSVTNQYAFLLGEDVAWMDIKDIDMSGRVSGTKLL